MREIGIVLAYFMGVFIACIIAAMACAIVYVNTMEREPRKVEIVNPLIIGNDTVRINQHFQVVK